MDSVLRVLHLEDDVTDTELVRATLEAEGLQNQLTRVQTENDFIAALKHGTFDVVLADYTLPSFDGLSALRIARQETPDLPFIFVSGTLGEDVATEALKNGATDYVLKTRLARLTQSVKRALREAEETMNRRRAEEALRRSEYNLAEAQRLAQTGSFVWDVKTKQALYLSDEWYRIYGFDRAVDKDAWDERLKRIHPDDLCRWQATIDRAVTEKSDYALEYRLCFPDAAIKYVHLVGHPVLDSSGEVIQLMGSVSDITGRKHAEQALRRSQAYLSEAQRLSHTGSWAFSVSSRAAAYWSEENFRIWGFDPRQPPDRDAVLQRIHPDDRETALVSTEQIAGESADVTSEFRIVLPNGTLKYIHSVAHPVLTESGGLGEIVGTHVDVTERKRAEALLAGETRVLEMIATGVPLPEILKALCLIMEEQRVGMVASLLLVNHDDQHLNVAAGPNLPPECVEQIEKLPIGLCAGSYGTGAYRRSPVIVSDVATDPLWNVPEHRAVALRHGLRALWSHPVLSSRGEVLGTFCMYYREPRSPSSQDMELLDLAAHIARVAIERDRAEHALRASEQLARSHVEVTMRSLDVLATEAAPEKFIAEMLRTISQHLGARSVMLWLCNQKDDALRLRITMEGEQQAEPDPKHPFIKDPYGWKENSLLQEMLFTRAPVVCDDIELDARIGAEMRNYLIGRACGKFLILPTLILGDVRGFIGIQHLGRQAYRPEEIELAQALTHHVMLAAHAAEIAEQQRHAAVLEERTRMARDIHDTLAQGFTGVIIQLDAAVEALRDEEPEGAAEHIRRARELARESLGEARRSMRALRPGILEQASFSQALRSIIEKITVGTPVRSKFQVEGDPRQLTPEVENNLLHIGQEALTNALKHARASEFEARLSFDAEAVRLELRDNGVGFLANQTNGAGFGLIGMRERTDRIGGTLTIASEPGAGTTIIAVSPYEQAKL